MGQGVIQAGVMCALTVTLSGCLSDGGGGFSEVTSRLKTGDATSVARSATHSEKVNSESQIIQGLAARRAALPSGSSFDKVATAAYAQRRHQRTGCPRSGRRSV
jgi:adhesin transport system outer membrane protein